MGNPELPKRSWFKVFFSGMCVGAADIVPGISGGTVAFIIGVYEELLKSLSTINRQSLSYLCRLKIRLFFSTVAWKFLLVFVLGVGCSFLTLAKAVTFLLNHELYRCYLYSVFTGLVIGSLFFCVRLISSFELKTVFAFVCGLVIAYFLSSADLVIRTKDPLYDVPLKAGIVAKTELENVKNYDSESNMILNVTQSQLAIMLSKKYLSKEDSIYNQTNNSYEKAGTIIRDSSPSFINIKLVLCGMLAISAMLLPGISGSYLLTILGVYGVVLGALVDFVEGLKVGLFDIAAFRIVFSVGIGIAVGAISFAKVVRFLLNHFRDITVACLIGFMLGAMKAVWPFWSYAYELSPLHLASGPMLKTVSPIVPISFSAELLISMLFFAAAVSSVFIIENIAGKKAKAPDLLSNIKKLSI